MRREYSIEVTFQQVLSMVSLLLGFGIIHSTQITRPIRQGLLLSNIKLIGHQPQPRHIPSNSHGYNKANDSSCNHNFANISYSGGSHDKDLRKSGATAEINPSISNNQLMQLQSLHAF